MVAQAWHHSFSPATTQVAMQCDHPANKSFFLALFYHIQVRPGCVGRACPALIADLHACNAQRIEALTASA